MKNINMNLEGIILAAGYSSRAGKFKMGLDIFGKSVIERCMEGMYDFCSKIYVVGGFEINKIISILHKYQKVEVILNKRFDDGMFTSVKEGMKQISGDRFFLTPGDYPLISRDICRSLLKAEGEIVIPAFNGRKGHPVLMNGAIAKEILLEPDSSSLRQFIQRRGYTLQETNDEGVLLDLDTEADYKRILSEFKSKYSF